MAGAQKQSLAEISRQASIAVALLGRARPQVCLPWSSWDDSRSKKLFGLGNSELEEAAGDLKEVMP